MNDGDIELTSDRIWAPLLWIESVLVCIMLEKKSYRKPEQILVTEYWKVPENKYQVIEKLNLL